VEFRIHFHLYTIIITNTYEIGTGIRAASFSNVVSGEISWGPCLELSIESTC
jgi:hypothetical protein